MNFGVALQADDGRIGYAGKTGPVQFVGAWGDLPSDHVWLTNLAHESLLLQPMSLRARLRRHDYLGARCEIILSWLCLNGESLEKQVSAMSEIAHRVLTLARRSYGVDPADEATLADALRIRLVSVTDSKGELNPLSFELCQSGRELVVQKQLATIINSAPISCDGRLPDEGAVPRLFAGNIDMAQIMQDLVDMHVPCGAWQEMPVSAFGDTTLQQCAMLSRLSQPVLAFGLIADIYDELARITRNALRPGARRWLTQPEIALMSRFASFVPEAVYVGERYVQLASTLSTPIGMTSPISDVGISSGLLAQSVLLALSRPVVSNGVNLTTSRAAWVCGHYRVRTLLRCIEDLPSNAFVFDYDVRGAQWFSMNRFASMHSRFDIISRISA